MRSLHFITALRSEEVGRHHVARKHAEQETTHLNTVTQQRCIRGSGDTCSRAMTRLRNQLQPQRKKKTWLLAVLQVDLTASSATAISFQWVTATADTAVLVVQALFKQEPLRTVSDSGTDGD